MALDLDLQSMQEARDLAEAAYKAQLIWGRASQEEVDRVCAAMADAAYQASARLGQMAHEETGYGIPAHKKLKNELASQGGMEQHQRCSHRWRNPPRCPTQDL